MHLASQICSAAQVLLGIGLIVLVLMHSGKDSGSPASAWAAAPAQYAGTAVMERNLTRLTIAVAIVFGINGLVVGLPAEPLAGTLRPLRAGGGIGRRARLRAL